MRQRFRDLPLAAKLLLPYVTLVLVAGALGTGAVVQGLTARAELTLREQLSTDLLAAQVRVRDQELYALESANYAANVRGIDTLLGARDVAAARSLLRSVVALKGDLDLLVVTDSAGRSVSEGVRSDSAGPLSAGVGTDWGSQATVRAALASTSGRPTAGLVRVGVTPYLVVAAPVCSAPQPCRPVGSALAGVLLNRVASPTAGSATSASTVDGEVLLGEATPVQNADGAAVPFRRSRVGGVQQATAVAGLTVQGARVGNLSVSRPTAAAFAGVRRAAYELVGVVILVLLGVVAVGVLLSRGILRQVRPLVQTHRALGAGDLSARVRVRSADELGEVSVGLNRMAEQLQASVTALESQVDQRTAEIRRLLTERTELFASVSHELRTPLAVVRAQVDLLLDEPGRKAAEREYLQAIRSSAGEALSVVNEVLELARNESGVLQVDLAAVPLHPLLVGLRPTLRGLGAVGDVTVSISVEEGVGAARADPRRLREVLLNLVDNAVKYTPASGTVAVDARADGGEVVFTVCDTGVGIPLQDQERVFEAFSRVEGARTQAGQASTGLGLALTRRLVEAQHGRITLQSDVGRGTTVTVRLPRMPGVSSRGTQTVTAGLGGRRHGATVKADEGA